jgi:hypothetical protein
MRKADIAVGSSSSEMCILVRLRGGWQKSAQTAEGSKLASHHALQVCAHLRIVWHIVGPGERAVGLFTVLSRCAAILLNVAVWLRVVALVVAYMLVEG